MRKYSTTLCVERNGEELELDVYTQVSRYVRAVTHLLPENCHPAEGGEIEITKITLDNEEWDGELTDDELSRVEDKISDIAQNDEEDEPPEVDDLDW